MYGAIHKEKNGFYFLLSEPQNQFISNSYRVMLLRKQQKRNGLVYFVGKRFIAFNLKSNNVFEIIIF
jgi:hypothetical protein